MGQQQQMGMPQPPVAPGQQPTGQEQTPQGQNQQQQQFLQLPQMDLSSFDSLQGEDRSNFVGNSIYGVIQGTFGDQYAPRITGMLLDESAVDFKLLLTNPQYFTSKVHEAHDLLVQSQSAQQQ